MCLADRFADMGLAVKADFRKIVGTNAERQKVVFDRCYDKLNKNGVVHQVVNGDNFHIRLRDLSICNGWACVYTGESDEDRRFRKYVLGKLDCNIPVYGWNDDEIAFIRDISEYGDYALPCKLVQMLRADSAMRWHIPRPTPPTRSSPSLPRQIYAVRRRGKS